MLRQPFMNVGRRASGHANRVPPRLSNLPSANHLAVIRSGVLFQGCSVTHGSRSYSAGPDQAARDRAAVGPATWRSAAMFVATGIGLYFYFEYEKKKVKEKKAAEMANVKTGKPKVGGPFKLTDQNGQPFTEAGLKGHWSLVYFGFTNCPDICPDELDKMGKVVEMIDKDHGPDVVLPVFVSVDPARDPVPQVKKYLIDFHPKMVGLTGSYDEVKQMCKAYRVYFSTPPDVKNGEDYLVDHSIYFYLMDPEGSFVNAFGKATTAVEVKQKFDEAVAIWKPSTAMAL